MEEEQRTRTIGLLIDLIELVVGKEREGTATTEELRAATDAAVVLLGCQSLVTASPQSSTSFLRVL